MSDSLILHALRDRRRYNTLRASVPDAMLSPDTTNVLAWYALYWSTFPEAERIEVDQLNTLIAMRADPNAGPEAIGIVQHLVSQLNIEPNADAVYGVQNMLRERDLSGKAGALLAAFNRGEEVDLSFELKALALEASRELQAGGVSQWANGDIAEYLKDDADEGGLIINAFGPILARTVRGLRPGHNVAIVMPTDKGKTSLLCRLMEGWAKQRREAFLRDGRPILCLINEGQAEKITTRLWSTVLNLTREQMYAMSNAGTLASAYNETIGAREAIILKNIHGKNVSQVEQIIEFFNPYVVITDMTGRIRAVSNRGGGANDISQLEEVWNGMRELAAIHDFLHVGTVQVSAEGFDMLYPPISAMQNAKVGIQTTLDLALMGGALTNLPNVRGISTPKNKLARANCNSLNQFQTVFDAERNLWVPPEVA